MGLHGATAALGLWWARVATKPLLHPPPLVGILSRKHSPYRQPILPPTHNATTHPIYLLHPRTHCTVVHSQLQHQANAGIGGEVKVLRAGHGAKDCRHDSVGAASLARVRDVAQHGHS